MNSYNSGYYGMSSFSYSYCYGYVPPSMYYPAQPLPQLPYLPSSSIPTSMNYPMLPTPQYNPAPSNYSNYYYYQQSQMVAQNYFYSSNGYSRHPLIPYNAPATSKYSTDKRSRKRRNYNDNEERQISRRNYSYSDASVIRNQYAFQRSQPYPQMPRRHPIFETTSSSVAAEPKIPVFIKEKDLAKMVKKVGGVYQVMDIELLKEVSKRCETLLKALKKPIKTECDDS